MEPVWRVFGASVEGTSHQRRDIPCQDAYAYRILPCGLALLAVADGAGSAVRSGDGAALAAAAAIDALEEALKAGPPQDHANWEGLLNDCFDQARRAVVQQAETEDYSPRAFATTLTCTVASDAALAVGQIGDGVVVARDRAGELFAASQPQHGEYANETYFLTLEGALEQLQVWVYPKSVEALALMTDGLVRLALDVVTNIPHSPFFDPLLTFAAQAEDSVEAEAQLVTFLTSDRVCARTDDDKTLLLAARLAESEDGVSGDPGA